MKTGQQVHKLSLQACIQAQDDARKERNKRGFEKLAFLILAVGSALVGGYMYYCMFSSHPTIVRTYLKIASPIGFVALLFIQYRRSEADYKHYNAIFQGWEQMRIKFEILAAYPNNSQKSYSEIEMLFKTTTLAREEKSTESIKGHIMKLLLGVNNM